MKGLLQVSACLIIAYVNVAVSYNPYSYTARFAPSNVDSYASMGDVDWGKRSYNPYLYFSRPSSSYSADDYSSMGDVNWAKRSLNPYSYNWMKPRSYAYHSMADADWGWKKRRDDSYDYDPIAQALSEDSKRSPVRYSKTYKYSQPYMKARPNMDAKYSKSVRTWFGKRAHPVIYLKGLKRANSPLTYYDNYGVARPQTRNSLGERQYSFGMADMDWGWKKRSQWPALMDIEDAIEIPDDDVEDNLEMEKKNVAALAEQNMFPPKHTLKFGKRNDEDVEDDEGIDEEKRSISSIVRGGRSVTSLVRNNGGIRQSKV